MKSHLHSQSLCGARRALIVAATAFLIGTLTAQTASPSNATDPSGRRNADSKSSMPARTDSTAIDPTYPSASSTAALPAGQTAGEKLSWSDKRFVTKAADGGQAEVQIAQLAADRASNPDVKSFAQKLVADHTAVNSELTTIASTKRVDLDKDEGQDRFYRRLSKKSGMDFDREFIEHMVDEHEKDVKMFDKASQDAKDADIRSFASKHVAHLREHLQQAQSLQQSSMATGRMDNSSGAYNAAPISSTSGTSSSSTAAGTTTSTTSADSSLPSTSPSPSDSPTRGANPTGGASSTDRGGSAKSNEPTRR
ncbi:MAG: DUF4142 domain-containing protein [Opitutaceae bacterium]